MVRKLEHDALSADLASVTELLSRRSREQDPIGYLQFSERSADLRRRLQELSDRPDTKASMAVFFAGGPVQGSRGIKADFAGKAVNLLQELIAKRFANLERGAMANVGPVPMRGNSDMLLTDIARGSVGIVLEEAGRNDSLAETELSVAVHKVAVDIEQTTQSDSSAFDELLSDVDARYFGALSQLFRLFDDARATVRLVERDQDVQLDGEAIHRGRERTDAAITNENDDYQMQGRLFVLPTTRRFELRASDETIHGIIAGEFAREHLMQIEADNVVNRDWLVRLKVRTITRPNKEPQVRYTLLGLIRQVNASPP